MLVELRSTGGQTVFPGSVHESGEAITWDADGELARVEAKELESAAARLAAATLLARRWPPEGSRQDAALAGGLLRAGWTDEKTAHFIEAICVAAGDEETRSRIETARYTFRKLAAGAHTTGWPTLAKIVAPRVVEKVREWLDLRSNEAQEQTAEASTQPAWPELHPAAMYGVAGDFVRLVEPHSEADPVALLIQFLIAFGNLVGRGAHFIAEADKHFTNLFAVLVGDTGTGRKGTAWGQAKRIFMGLDGQRKRRYLNKTIKGKKKAAQDYLSTTLSAISAGTFVEASPLTVSEYLDKWLETAARRRVTERTFTGYEWLLKNYVRPALGQVRLSDVRRSTCRAYTLTCSRLNSKPKILRNRALHTDWACRLAQCATRTLFFLPHSGKQ